MNLQYIRDFVVLEEVRNYENAAKMLQITRSSLTRHIAALEKEWGQPLFLHEGRKLELTAFGGRFLIHAKKFAAAWEACKAELEEQGETQQERMVVGVFGSLSRDAMINNAITETLRRLSSHYPDMPILTVQGELARLKDKLVNKEYDLAFARENTTRSDEEFERINVRKDPLCLLVSKSDPLADEAEIEIQTLKNRVVTSPALALLSLRLFVEHCHNEGFEPMVDSVLREHEFLENFSSDEKKVLLLCESKAYQIVNPETQVIKRIKPKICEYVNLVCLKESLRSEVIRRALRCFQEVSEISFL